MRKEANPIYTAVHQDRSVKVVTYMIYGVGEAADIDGEKRIKI